MYGFFLGSMNRSPRHSSNHIPNALELGITLVGAKKLSSNLTPGQGSPNRNEGVKIQRTCRIHRSARLLQKVHPGRFFFGPDHLKNAPE